MSDAGVLRVLALEPYHGGSHAAFLDGWRRHGRHRWTVEALPASHWKWRMRGAAPVLADRVAERRRRGEAWDVVVASDMLDLAAFRGLAPPPVGDLPTVVYFHENQLTYPLRDGAGEAERDLHFAVTNLTTCLAADQVWFNSAFHRDEWLGALPGLLARVPDHRPRRAVERVAARSRVEPPGIEWPPARPAVRPPGPLRVAWAARWEHDKRPDRFFAALAGLEERGVEFRLSVLGQSFRRVPADFAAARRRFADRIDHWGWQERREDYLAALAAADVVVSTADHEFFGLAVVEAVAAGCYPLLPDRLAYPEVLAALEGEAGQHLYRDDPGPGGDGVSGGGAAERGAGEVRATPPDAAGDLADRLAGLAARLGPDGERRALWGGDPDRGRRAVRRFAWSQRAAALDAALRHLAGG